MDRKARLAIAAFVALIGIGTIGYTILEGWPLLDSLYMTIITLSTVGFGEVHNLTPLGKVFTGGLILSGVGTLAYAATKATEALLERGVIRRRRMGMEIRRLDGHVVVCGYGRMGVTVVDQLHAREVPFVVIDKDPERIAELEGRGLLYVQGDATTDAVLAQAGVERARAMATVLANDADNLFVTLTARSVNRAMTIIARSSNEKNDRKMIAAGATRVLNPYLSGGRLLARQLLHPSVTEFIDAISQWADTDLALEEVRLEPTSSLAGVTLRDAPIRRELDVIVVGVRGGDGGMRFNPPPDLAPAAGDTLVLLGRRDNLRRVAALAEGGGD